MHVFCMVHKAVLCGKMYFYKAESTATERSETMCYMWANIVSSCRANRLRLHGASAAAMRPHVKLL